MMKTIESKDEMMVSVIKGLIEVMNLLSTRISNLELTIADMREELKLKEERN